MPVEPALRDLLAGEEVGFQMDLRIVYPSVIWIPCLGRGSRKPLRIETFAIHFVIQHSMVIFLN